MPSSKPLNLVNGAFGRTTVKSVKKSEKNSVASDLHTIAEKRLFREQLKNPVSEFTTDAASITKLIEECNDLATRAFEKNDTSAHAMAERLLFDLQFNHSYTAPTQAVPGLVWGILMRSKLRNAFKTHGGHGPATVKEMVAALTKAVEKEAKSDHEAIRSVCSAGRDAIRIFTKNWFNSVRAFEKHMVALLQRAPSATYESIIENISDEYINGESHQNLRLRWGAEFGVNHVTQDPLADSEYRIESFSLLSFRTALSVMNEPSYGLGAFYTMEALFPKICATLYKELSTQGFSESCLEFWRLHSVADIEHSQEWLHCLENAGLSKDQCGLVIDGAVTQLGVRRKMMDGFKRLAVSKAA